jgi:SAM-dependent methyltransferase
MYLPRVDGYFAWPERSANVGSRQAPLPWPVLRTTASRSTSVPHMEMDMDDPASSAETAAADSAVGTVRYNARDFWRKENLKFAQAHFRMERAVRIINAITQGREADLLDVGCGPGTLMHLLGENIHYYGIDIAIHDPAPNLIEADFLKAPIAFGGRLFDIVVAQGVFEYIGTFQSQKLAEISNLLTDHGKFIASYWNFGHRDKHVYPVFNNIQSVSQFRAALTRYFSIDRSFPVGHNWRHHEPARKSLGAAAQMRVNMNIPFVSPALAVEYFFICSPNKPKRT